MGYGMAAVNTIAQGIPKITVAAILQKDPWCLIAHPNSAIKILADLKGKPIYVFASVKITYWLLLEAKYGFTKAHKRPYNFNLVAFLIEKNSAQQGYITFEAFAIEKQGGFQQVVFLLTDFGYQANATTIETKK
ncbi:ABC transporter substrate-binding protein [Nostoc sp.]|uniref:ABC transporter substrate-binding protein n=1 Tax=Nostoc sp. TaxID=1180 RepID=UPI002FFC3506